MWIMSTLNGTERHRQTAQNNTSQDPGEFLVAQNGTRLKLRGEAARTKTLEDSLPRGIVIGVWGDNRPKRFFIRFSSKGSRTVESFESELIRNDRAVTLADLLENEGKHVLDYKPAEWRLWQQLKEETGATIPLLREAWRLFSPSLLSTISTNEAIKTYLALKITEKIKKGSSSHSQMKTRLGFLAVKLGEKRLSLVTADDLRKRLAEVPDRAGKVGQGAGITKKSYLKDWMTFFNRAKTEKWIPDNVCKLVIPPAYKCGVKPIIIIQDAFQLLKANLAEPVTPRLSLEMFGFLRASSAGRIQKDRLNFDEHHIVMEGMEHKSGLRQFRKGHLPVLWAWLDLATKETWEMTEKQYTYQKSLSFIRSGVSPLKNALRHSCISYHIAARQEIATASMLAQHTNIKQTTNYEGAVTQSDALLWAKLTPQAVAGTWEEFLAANPRAPKSTKATNE